MAREVSGLGLNHLFRFCHFRSIHDCSYEQGIDAKVEQKIRTAAVATKQAIKHAGDDIDESEKAHPINMLATDK